MPEKKSGVAGSWDIVTGPDPQGRTREILSGTLEPTDESFVDSHIGFEIREENEMLPLEVRVYLEKGQVMKLSGIEITRIRDI